MQLIFQKKTATTVNGFQKAPGFNILFLGRLTYQKNLPFLLTNFSKLVQSYPDLSLTIVGDGELREALVDEILTAIPAEKIIWEAPRKDQQLYFIELLGQNVNLGNISPHEVIALEAMRVGLRADSFHLFLKK